LFRRYWLTFTYVIFEMIPTFFVGVISFVSILLLFQTLKLTDTLLQHDVSLRTIVHLLSYMSISFLPAILPMSLIFSVVLAYNRLTADSEVIAFKSLGLSMWPLMAPALVLSLVISIMSAYTSFRLGPWGNRQFELLISEIANSKIISRIEEGTFSGFFNLVVYTNKINKDTEELEKVFIYDERDPSSPTTIIADRGKIVSEKSNVSYKAFVRLLDGDIHKVSKEGHTKINFKTYDLQIVEPKSQQSRGKSMESMTDKDLKDFLTKKPPPSDLGKFIYEWHKRIALSGSCILFALLGTGLGCRTHNRTGKSGGGVVSVGVIVVYWILFILGNSLSKNPTIPIWLGAWLPFFILTPASIYFLKKNWN
jgi:lipopolysaccharide export system permease protein